MLRHLRLASAIVPLMLVLNGCSDEPGADYPADDGGTDGHAVTDGASHVDAGGADGAQAVDSGHVVDATVPDANVPPADAGIPDTSVADTSVADTSVADTSVADTSVADTGSTDTGVQDAGTVDAAVVDSGPDSGTVDSGNDAGIGVLDSGIDTGVIDSGIDTGVVDAGVVDAADASTPTNKVGGTLSGLHGGSPITLRDNGGDDLVLDANGAFSFATALHLGATYAVTIATQPALQTCTVTGGTGVVTAVPVTSVSVTCTGSLAYYFPFDGDATDQSGNGHDGEVHGATLDVDRHGNANSAYNFTSGTWIQAAGDSLPIGNSERTITAWLRPNVDNADWGIIYFGNGDCTGKMFGLGGQSGSQVTYWGGCDDSVSGYHMVAGDWSFAAIRFVQPDIVRITYNGVTTDYAGHNPQTTPSNLWIGGETIYNDNTGFRNYFDGAIDSIRIYDRALTDAELSTVYTTLP